MSTFGDILKKLRKSQDLTQTQLAEKLGLAFSTISMYERGEREPDFETMEAIADYFNVSMDYLHGKSNSFHALESNATVLDSKVRMIPLYESVSAGFGVCAQDRVIDYIPLPIESEYEAAETLCIKVSGNSMYPKIEDGDIIVVRKQSSIDSGKVGVFLVDEDDAVVKKVEYVDGEDWLILISFNPEYAPRRFEGADVQRVRVLGLVKQVIKEI